MAKYKSLACCAALLNLALAPLVAAAESTLPIQPALGEGCSYSLTPAQQDAPNVLTFYNYAVDENGVVSLVPQYYQVNLKKSVYGNAEERNAFGFIWEVYQSEWTLERSDNYEPSDVENGDVIEYRYSYDNVLDRILDVTEDSIVGNFIFNDDVDEVAGYGVGGGAIYNNDKTITSISGDFVGNYVTKRFDNMGRGYGGAIHNAGTIESLIGSFIGNYVNTTNSLGGAIANPGKIGTIMGDFIGNHAIAPVDGNGGAICNGNLSQGGSIDSIVGNFIGNYVKATNSYGYGGAIYNNYKSGVGSIGSVTGDFIGNYAWGGSGGYGGAIYNIGYLTVLKGDFIGNYAGSEYGAQGGALYNTGMMESITGSFVGNYAEGEVSTQGGALYNTGSIESITGNFVENYIIAKGGTSANSGGAIYNQAGTIGSIKGNFIRNYVSAAGSTGALNGGAIYNNSGAIIEAISGDFIGNHGISATSTISGGAIYNQASSIGAIKGNFIGNYVETTGSKRDANGGAIYNYNSKNPISIIEGDFIGNYAKSETQYVYGGAIYNNNSSVISKISGNFTGNFTESGGAHSNGGAIYNSGGATITEIVGNFTGNYAETTTSSSAYAVNGGAIYNAGTIDSISGNFTNNHAQSENTSASGGVISNSSSRTINNIIGNFTGNYAKAMLAAQGGAISNKGTMGSISGSFLNNYAESLEGEAKGGAIYTEKALTISADDKRVVIQGNYITDATHTEKYYQAIYSKSAQLTFDAKNGGEIYVDDLIDGTSYAVVVSGDSSSKVTFNRELLNAKSFTASGVALYLGASNRVSTDHTSVAAAAGTSGYDYESSLLKDVTGKVTLNNGARLNTMDGRATNYTLGTFAANDASISLDIIADGTSYDLTILKEDGTTETVQAMKSDRLTLGDGSTGLLTISSLAISGSSDSGNIYAQILDYEGEDDAIQLALESAEQGTASAIMDSRSVMVKSMELLTSKTKNDTLHLITGGSDDILSEWGKVTSDDKTFTVFEGDTIQPASDINDDGVLGGKTIAIEGFGKGKSTLSMGNKKFLDTITDDQSITLRAITVNKDKPIVNKGTLTLESLELNTSVQNDNTLKVKGSWEISNTITGGGNVTIDAELVTISGTVEKQNITHSGESETHLVAKDGTFSNFTDNSLKMESGNLYLHAPAAVAAVSTYSLVRPMAASSTIGAVSLGSSTLNLDKLTLGNGNIYVGTVEVNLAEKTMGRIVAKEYETTGTGKIYVSALAANKHDNSNETSFAVKFADAAIAAHVVPFENEPQQGRPTDGSPWVSGSKRVVGLVFEWDVAYSYDSGEYLFSRDGSTPGTGDDPGEEPNTPDVTPDVSPDNPPPSKDKDKPVGPDYNPNFDEDATPPRDPGSSSGSGEGGSGSGEGGSGSGGYTPSTPDTDSPDEGNNTPGQDKPSNPGSTRPKPHLGVNPSVMAASVAGQSAFFSMAQVLNHSFGHADMYSTHLALEHRKRRNGAMTASEFFGRSYKPAYFCAPKPQEGQLPGFKGGIFMNAYASFEKLSLNGVPETDLDMYGAVVTGSTDLHEYENGMASVFSVHAAYMGARQKFSRAYYNGVSSVRTNQNGGAVGATFTLYKGGFYSALSASFGSAGAHSTTMSGSENFRSYMAGVASRSGYSIALGNSGVVLQPTLQISYMHVSTEDFTDPSGVYMDSDPMNVIQLNPYLKVIAHTSSGWDPFATGGYVRNLMGESKVQAKWDTSSYTLPEISVDSYWEYSLGIQKTWADLYTFYGQVTGRSGDCKGVEVSAGLRWAW